MKLEFHHINYVSHDVDKMHEFYTDLLGLADIPLENFPRTEADAETGYDGKIRFATEGSMQFHLAEFLRRLDEKGIPYSDYGTAFAKEWHQVFFQDPEGNVIEVHQQVADT